MWMVRHGRTPGVEHRSDADARAQVLGIGRDDGHGLGRGREQDVVDRGLVLIGDGGDDRVGATLAARHMAAERRRAAALDRRHHLHLVEADVSGIGATPRRPVVAEDIRDLQRWTGHAAGCYAGGWSFLFFLSFLRGCDSRSSGLSMPAIMPVATRV